MVSEEEEGRGERLRCLGILGDPESASSTEPLESRLSDSDKTGEAVRTGFPLLALGDFFAFEGSVPLKFKFMLTTSEESEERRGLAGETSWPDAIDIFFSLDRDNCCCCYRCCWMSHFISSYDELQWSKRDRMMVGPSDHNSIRRRPETTTTTIAKILKTITITRKKKECSLTA
jgi:hypothetical protein